MLPALMYEGLREKRLPLVYPARRLSDTLKARRIRRRSVTNILRKAARPLTRNVKLVAIEKTDFSGYRAIYRGAYIAVYGDEVSYRAWFKNRVAIPLVAKTEINLEEAKKIIHVLFMPMAVYESELRYTVERPEYLRASASAVSETGLFRYDRINETFTVGVLDDRYKPVGEYPVSGVDNAVLDLTYDWRVANLIYPLPLPEGLSFDTMSVSIRSGLLNYAGKFYKDPTVNNVVRAAARIRNNTGSTITVRHWGFPLSVLYEDRRHVSQVNIDVSFPERRIPHGGSYSYYIDFNLPTWAYGHIAAAHALNIYKDQMYIYGGGPCFQFEVFRLRLP